MASGFSKGPSLGLLPDVPSLMETLSYSYCYVGIMTGEYTCPSGLPLLALSVRSSICRSEGELLSDPPTGPGLLQGRHALLPVCHPYSFLGASRR